MTELTYMLTRPTVETSRFIRTKEAALYLGVSQKRLRELKKAGRIAVVVRGNVWLFDVRELDRYADSLRADRLNDQGRSGIHRVA